MKILVVGKNGRAHELVWKISLSPLHPEIFCAPGNAGIAQLAQCVPIRVDDIKALADYAEENSIDLTVVSPEVPLVLGIVDEFESRGLKIVGPSKDAAMIEGSKIWAAEFNRRHGIPAPQYVVFRDAERAKKFVRKHPKGVVKADGPAAGKGVVIYATAAEGIAAIEKIMVRKEFGEAGNGIVIQEFVYGKEATFIVATDGVRAIPIISAQDYKKAKDKNKGPNTGGMGAEAPAETITKEL